MAKKVRFSPVHDKKEQEEKNLFKEIQQSLPEDVRKEMESLDIHSFDDLLELMVSYGIDPMKMMDFSMNNKELPADFNPRDVMFDDEFDGEDDDDFDDDDDDDYDEDGEDEGKFDDEEYLLGMKLPKQRFIGPSKREFHIRIKLNNAPVKIWRELVVPSNITLEMLAYVLIDAMGWRHEHLYQFIGKGDVYYMNTAQLKEEGSGFRSFFGRIEYRNSDKTTLEKVLQPKGERLKFEYDFGDSWMHELWVKAARDYAPGEQPAIRLLKGQGACPPEDCGGVWGYAELLELRKKKRKTADEKERLEWYDIPKGYDPDDCDLEWLQEDVDDLCERINE